jgi:hypothetical protein
MRNLSSDDIEKVLTHSPRSVAEGLPGTFHSPILSLHVSLYWQPYSVYIKSTLFFVGKVTLLYTIHN